MTKTNAKTKNAPPLARFRIGLVQAAIWENPNENGKSYPSVTFKRSYKKKDGSWGAARDYNLQDLLALRAVLDQATAKLLEFNGSTAETEAGDDTPATEEEVTE
jgi:hypothetical protein